MAQTFASVWIDQNLFDASVWIDHNLFDTSSLQSILMTHLSVNAKRGIKEYNLMDLFWWAKHVQRGNANRFIQSVHPREHKTRWDIKLTYAWVDKMKQSNIAFSQACDMCEHIKRVKNTGYKAKVEWHAMIVHPGSPAQPIHIDDEQSTKKGRRFYYTFIIPLTFHPDAGGTYFLKINQTFTSFGGAAVFDGAVEHAGLANKSLEDRVFLYAAIFTGQDIN